MHARCSSIGYASNAKEHSGIFLREDLDDLETNDVEQHWQTLKSQWGVNERGAQFADDVEQKARLRLPSRIYVCIYKYIYIYMHVHIYTYINLYI